MGRFVGLYFEDNEKGERFAEQMKDADSKGVPFPSGGQIVALFAVPTMFCECPENPTKPRRQVRGSKYGWWVHKECGKPMANSFQHPRNLLEKVKLGAGEQLGFTVNWMFRSGVMRGWKNRDQ